MSSQIRMRPSIAIAAMLLCSSIGSAQVIAPPVPVPVTPPVAVPAAPVVTTDPVVVGPLGIRVLPADPDGIRVAGLLPGGPATVLNPGDIIVDINGRPVSPVTVQDILRGVRPGQQVTLRVLRNGVIQPVTITVVEPTVTVETEKRAAEFLGMFLTESATGNVVVSRVVSGSPAAAAGVLPGDVLTRVEDYRVAGIRSFLDYVSTLLAAAAPGDQIDVEATRGTGLVQFRLRVPGREVVQTAATVPVPAETVPSSQVVFCMEVRNYGAGRVVVLNVMEGSPADVAGIRSGDVISSVGDRDVRSAEQLAEAVLSYNRGDKVVFGIARGGQLRNVEVAMAPCEYVRPAPSAVDLETAAEQIRILRSQIDDLQRTVEVLSYTIERAQPPQPLDDTPR